MKKLVCASFLALLAPVASAQEPRGVEDIFSPGFILEDRNGDGVIDFVNAELELGESPSPAAAAAASDVAARLGFETMAMNLPLTGSRAGAVIAIGTRPPAGAATLAAGEGLVTTASVEGRDQVLLAGGDEEGLRAAAAYLAGRAPHLWDPKGPTFDTVDEDLRRLFGFEPLATRVAEVRATRSGLSRLLLEAELGSAEEMSRARSSLRE
jgi:hypothetical protein